MSDSASAAFQYRRNLPPPNISVEIVGISEPMAELKARTRMAAASISSVLIEGESGTGKDLAAKAIHRAGPRGKGPFVAVNCAALPESVIESELFGYEEGSFTGAKKGRQVSRFELANCGTLFLDEIGDMPLCAQMKLLRVVQERKSGALAHRRPRYRHSNHRRDAEGFGAGSKSRALPSRLVLSAERAGPPRSALAPTRGGHSRPG